MALSVPRRHRLAWFAWALCFSAWSQDASEAPVLKEGDRWQYQISDGFTGLPETTEAMRIVSVRPDGYQLEWSLGGETSLQDLTPSLNARQSVDGVAGDTGELVFPLKVGNRWKSASLVLNRGNRVTSLLELDREVVAFERIKVPAGEFQAFKIVAKGTWTLKSDPLKVSVTDIRGRYDWTGWYAPAVKRYVAVESASYAKGHVGRRAKTVLTEFELH